MSRRRDALKMTSFLEKSTSRLGLEELPDPRSRQGRRWKLSSMLRGVLWGLMAGCQDLEDIECLTEDLPKGARRATGIFRRLPDTTLRDLLCRLSFKDIRGLLIQSVRIAARRKSLDHQVLPMRTVAMDGKAIAATTFGGLWAQRHDHEGQAPFGVLRTITSTLVSSPARPCIDISPIPAVTNEMGHFHTAFAELCQHHANLFDLVTYDAGATCQANAKAVVDAGKDYLFRLNDERWHMQKSIEEMLEKGAYTYSRIDTVNNTTEVHRTIRLKRTFNEVIDRENGEIWSHAMTMLCVTQQTYQRGEPKEGMTRYFISSMKASDIGINEWLDTIIAHWGVETTHQILDTAFAEDDRRVIHADEVGMLIMMTLRRIAYTLLTMFRAITLRSDDKRAMKWKRLIKWVERTLIAWHSPKDDFQTC